MLLHVPGSLDGLLFLLAPCFTQPTFQTFRALLVGQVSQTGRRTVCGMLVGAKLSGVWEHSRAHRFFSYARWSPDELGLRIAVLIAQRLLDPGVPIVVALDDTLLQRWGRKVYGCFYHHDATANGDRSAVAWGNNWVVVGIVVRLAIVDRPVCLPVLFGLWRPRRKQIPKGKRDPQRPSKPQLARELVDLLAARLGDRQLDVVGDAAYATNAWRGVGDRVTVTSRLRHDAALYDRRPPRTGQRGRPAGGAGGRVLDDFEQALDRSEPLLAEGQSCGNDLQLRSDVVARTSSSERRWRRGLPAVLWRWFGIA